MHFKTVCHFYFTTVNFTQFKTKESIITEKVEIHKVDSNCLSGFPCQTGSHDSSCSDKSRVYKIKDRVSKCIFCVCLAFIQRRPWNIFPLIPQLLAKQVLKECGGEMEKNKGEDSTSGTANSPGGQKLSLWNYSSRVLASSAPHLFHFCLACWRGNNNICLLLCTRE